MKNKVTNFLNTKPENFSFKEGMVFGKQCVLITPTPNMKVEWDKNNEIFRSCLCDKNNGKIYNLGFKKFTNFTESPNFQPWNISWKIEARHKLDGSLLCISKIDGNVVVRTRGTFDAIIHETGEEIKLFKNKYPYLFNNEYINSEEYTILCEHTTPKRIIVLREHEEPTLTLIGIISNLTGEYVSQTTLDQLGKEWNINRPQKYEYNSVEECILDVSAWQGKEGVVLYSPDGQTLKKIKASEYLSLHALATGVKGVKQVLGVFMESHRPTTYDEFYKYVEDTMDHEIAEKCKDYMQDVVNAFNDFRKDVEDIEYELDTYIKKLDTRKDQAIAIQTRFRTGIEKSMAFTMLDKAFIDDKLVQKYMENKLKI